MKSIALMAALTLLPVTRAADESLLPEPAVTICLLNYDQARGQARYRARIQWNGLQAGSYHRIDLAMEDDSGAIYPQFHDSRTPMRAAVSERMFVVSDRSSYPLKAFLIGMTEEAATTFDTACHGDGFCSIEMRQGSIDRLGQGTLVTGPMQTLPCTG